MYKYQIVNSWDEFESLCLKLFQQRWNCQDAQKNGRQGQKQKGVDIFGKPSWSKKFYGVQCKHKDYDKTLTIDDIKEECEKAKKFTPALEKLYFATTDKRNSTLQEEVRLLNEKTIYPFEVVVFSWNDIEEELNSRPLIVKQFYPNTYISPEYSARETQIIIPEYNAKDNFYSFFYREPVKYNISEPVLLEIISVMYELADNSYRHGKASQVTILRDGNKFILEDDGKQFNPIEQLKGNYTLKEKMGSGVFQNFLFKYRNQITIQYKYENEKNILIFNICDFEILSSETSYQEIILNFEEMFGRIEAEGFANANRIKSTVKEVILDITKLPSFSAAGSLISYYEKMLGKNQKLIVYLPRNAGNFFNHLISDDRIRFYVR